MVKCNILSKNRHSKLHAVIDCLFSKERRGGGACHFDMHALHFTILSFFDLHAFFPWILGECVMYKLRMLIRSGAPVGSHGQKCYRTAMKRFIIGHALFNTIETMLVVEMCFLLQWQKGNVIKVKKSYQHLKISGVSSTTFWHFWHCFLNAALNIELSSYFKKPFKLNHSKQSTVIYYKTPSTPFMQ